MKNIMPVLQELLHFLISLYLNKQQAVRQLLSFQKNTPLDVDLANEIADVAQVKEIIRRRWWELGQGYSQIIYDTPPIFRFNVDEVEPPPLNNRLESSFNYDRELMMRRVWAAESLTRDL